MATKIHWTSQLATGITLIDSQHQEFIRRINVFLDRCADEGCSTKDLEQTFGFLLSYALTHFEDEQQCMQAHAFAGRSRHKQQHEKLSQWLQQTWQQWQGQPPSPDQVFKVCYFLYDWLTQHILKEDMAMAAHLRRVAPPNDSAEI